MDEKTKEANEKKPEKKSEAETEADAAEEAGDKGKTIETLDRADEIAERQKRENDRREKLIEREEALAARKAVGGDAEGGTTGEGEKKEETPKEYNDRIDKEISEGKHNE